MNETNSSAPVAMISGGNTGVGAACARRMARRGYRVAINYFENEEASRSLVSECRQLGRDAFAHRGDVSQDDDCRTIVNLAADRWGRLDALICCAGTTQYCELSDMDIQNDTDFQRIYGVNTISIYQLARAAEPHLRKSDNGSLVSISSIASMNGMGSSIGYIASKGAINSLTFVLARLLAPEVRVNAILPGLVNSTWFVKVVGKERWEEIKSNFTTTAALGTYCEPDDIAQSVEFLSVDAHKITGQLLTVDAGFSLGELVTYGEESSSTSTP